MNTKHVLILSGGTIDADFACSYIKSGHFDWMIAADSGLDYCYKAGLLPDLILGDFDSAAPEILDYYKKVCPERIQSFPVRKDWTDTELALRKAIEEGAGQITVLGATGSRLDHVLGNIQLLKQSLDVGVETILADANNRIRLINHSLILKKKELWGKYVSLIPFTPKVTGLTLHGFAYNVEAVVLESGKTLGVSNEVSSEEATIELTDGLLLVMESRDG